MKASKIQEEIEERYAEFEKEVEPLRQKRKEEERKHLLKILSKHKGIIYKKSYGKNYHLFKILKSVSEKGRLKYTKIIIEDKEDYSINYIKERKTSSKRELLSLIKKYAVTTGDAKQ